ncbi:TOPRIM nucleotidyl transferase/hydrolase domain-containing protein [Clostridium thermarum]|uniref:TOPRIM nucleotidyl transferase/hydrolase domain-containing protein n=1 Tax=Clostridium thermarum TaxID=1716543 RepID=UPI0013D7EA06|nr:TOPRIM nucleotidyl transferase/hydrolase domain-containing protein [Clostridium thermarum]
MNSLNNNLMVFIGKNGSGKTYALNEMLDQQPENTLYISEEGIAKVAYQKNNVMIDLKSNKYLYVDEMKRGEKAQVEEYQIVENAKSIINYCWSIISKLNSIIKKSQGQKKLENMMNIFLKYNLNNIDTILFDEPENYFDEEYLKLIGLLIKTLVNNSYKVRIATHNSRLLSILEVDIDNIILIDNRIRHIVKKEDIKKIFLQISNSVEQIRESRGWSESKDISYKLKIHQEPIVFDNYINSNLQSIDFYSSLFFKNIIIVEGMSDLEALKTINEKFDNNVFIYSANGKAWIPFYANLFLSYGKNVTAIIDVDNETKTHAAILTKILEENTGLKLIKHNPDMETEYGIDLDSIGESLGMSKKIRERNKGWIKQIAAYYYFKVNENWRQLERKILHYEDDKFDFE